MPKIRALKKSADHEVGDVYEVSEQEARILTAPDGLGGQRAERVVEARIMTAEDLPVGEERKGRYSRRDMRAKE